MLKGIVEARGTTLKNSPWDERRLPPRWFILGNAKAVDWKMPVFFAITFEIRYLSKEMG